MKSNNKYLHTGLLSVYEIIEFATNGKFVEKIKNLFALLIITNTLCVINTTQIDFTLRQDARLTKSIKY